jgi:hypothetical protein
MHQAALFFLPRFATPASSTEINLVRREEEEPNRTEQEPRTNGTDYYYNMLKEKKAIEETRGTKLPH